MEIDDDEFAQLLEDIRQKSLKIQGRRLLGEARGRILPLRARIDAVQPTPQGVMHAVDRRFESTQTFQPSTMIRTQLRLAIHYVQAADQGGFPVGKSQSPTLSSFVVLRTAIECAATAHWLLSSKSHREWVERALRRMWWDTVSAAEMATVADGQTDQGALRDLEARIDAISRPIKGLNAVKILESERPALSRIVSDASALMRPESPTLTRSGWMLCSGVAHGNIPISAGAGVSAALVQRPADHLIDDGSYGYVFSSIMDDIELTTALFEQRASEKQAHQRPQAS